METVPPYRVSRTCLQTLEGSPDQVFPLLCPVRECDWVNGWDPKVVITESGIAERDCVFIIGPEDIEATWVIVEYEPPVWIEFLKLVPQHTVGRISIGLRPGVEGGTTAEVTYAYTAISERGRAAVNGFTEGFYRRFIQDWENELNYYLRTGGKKPQEPAPSPSRPDLGPG